jgi:hypothetical protein
MRPVSSWVTSSPRIRGQSWRVGGRGTGVSTRRSTSCTAESADEAARACSQAPCRHDAEHHLGSRPVALTLIGLPHHPAYRCLAPSRLRDGIDRTSRICARVTGRLRSRVGQHRTYLKHLLLEPLMVAGPWVAAAGAVYAGAGAWRDPWRTRGPTGSGRCTERAQRMGAGGGGGRGDCGGGGWTTDLCAIRRTHRPVPGAAMA